MFNNINNNNEKRNIGQPASKFAKIAEHLITLLRLNIFDPQIKVRLDFFRICNHIES